MDEPEVVERTHAFLQDQGVSRLFTDSHESLRGRRTLEPYQRFTVDLGDFVVHPDLVALEADGETVIAVEAKGSGHRDLVLGLAQAELYQVAFHRTYLAADAASIGSRLTVLARLRNVGLLAVGDGVAVVNEPDAWMPLREAYRAIARQMEALQEVADRPSFSLNLPTHYLAWAIALQGGRDYSPSEAGSALKNYPIRDLVGALRGARSLGLVRQRGEVIELTDTGAAVKMLLPRDLAQWADIHRRAASRDRTATLAALCPSAGATLRLLLLQQPTVRLLIEGLRAVGGSGSLVDLAAACDRLDHARAPVVFLVSEAPAELQDLRGAVAWARAAPTAFRPTVSYQLKSVLRHAGLLAADVRLGGGRRLVPVADRWTLA